MRPGAAIDRALCAALRPPLARPPARARASSRLPRVAGLGAPALPARRVFSRALLLSTLTFAAGSVPGRAMAWRSSGRSNDDLVDNLHRNGIIEHDDVAAAMRSVDRANYVVRGSRAEAYQDAPQPIGHGATISAPHMHAHCLEVLHHHLKPGARVLDVGSGTGYLTALFSAFVGSDGVVVGVEHVPELVRLAERNFQADGKAHLLATKKHHPRGEAGDGSALSSVRFVAADGRLGYEPEAPYDAIHVGAAAPHVPDALVEQLARGGRMVIPVGPEGGAQQLVAVDKDASGGVTRKGLMGVVYVPLCDKEHQVGRY